MHTGCKHSARRGANAHTCPVSVHTQSPHVPMTYRHPLKSWDIHTHTHNIIHRLRVLKHKQLKESALTNSSRLPLHTHLGLCPSSHLLGNRTAEVAREKSLPFPGSASRGKPLTPH